MYRLNFKSTLNRLMEIIIKTGRMWLQQVELALVSTVSTTCDVSEQIGWQ